MSSSTNRFLPLIGWLLVSPLGAQLVQAPSSKDYETRAQIEAAARSADASGRKSEAWLLRSRLQNGDFQEGDRIVVALENSARVDTLQVKSGRVLPLVGMGTLSLAGVLRSELTDTLRHHLARYLKNPGVHVTPLIPISVQGSVGLPGFYYTSADVALTDLIMRAGGPHEADLRRTTIRRSGQVIWQPADVQVAISEGLSLDRLHMRAGDEIFVPSPRRRFSAATTLSVLSAVTTMAVLLFRH